MNKHNAEREWKEGVKPFPPTSQFDNKESHQRWLIGVTLASIVVIFGSLLFKQDLSSNAKNAASSRLSVTTPTSVCKMLNNIGLKTNDWKAIYDSKFGCHSPYKNIGSGSPLANNLAYYVDGSHNLVTQAKLVLNINILPQVPTAKLALLESSNELSKKLTGSQLPQQISNAIKEGSQLKIKMENWSIEVRRDNWSNGTGYEIHVIFE